MSEPTKQQTSRRGFGAAFLAAMHDWRQRQAAREIEYYQHLKVGYGFSSKTHSSKTRMQTERNLALP
jgi:hypothetical protein